LWLSISFTIAKLSPINVTVKKGGGGLPWIEVKHLVAKSHH
jgi:hypothetical protein